MNIFPVQYARILLKLTDELDGPALETAVHTYFEYIKSEKVLNKMTYILREYERLAHEAAGTSPLQVTVAHEPTSNTKKDIEQQFGGSIDTVTVDPSLVGGVIVRKGNTILNASVTKQLELLANSMK